MYPVKMRIFINLLFSKHCDLWCDGLGTNREDEPEGILITNSVIQNESPDSSMPHCPVNFLPFSWL